MPKTHSYAFLPHYIRANEFENVTPSPNITSKTAVVRNFFDFMSRFYFWEQQKTDLIFKWKLLTSNNWFILDFQDVSHNHWPWT